MIYDESLKEVPLDEKKRVLKTDKAWPPLEVPALEDLLKTAREADAARVLEGLPGVKFEVSETMPKDALLMVDKGEVKGSITGIGPRMIKFAVDGPYGPRQIAVPATGNVNNDYATAKAQCNAERFAEGKNVYDAKQDKPTEYQRNHPQEFVKEHTEAVGKFLSELYAIMVDPLEDGKVSVSEMCGRLIDAAQKQRNQLQYLDYLETQKAEYEPIENSDIDEDPETRPDPKDPHGLQLIASNLGALLVKKNAAYGSAFAKTGDYLKLLYPEGIKPEQYAKMLVLVRDFDKAIRIATDEDAFGENPFLDKAGYGVLGSALK